MASKYIPAVLGLNKFLWNFISGDIFDGDYRGLVPIIPTGEAPQLLQVLDEQPGIGNSPYIVYTYYTNGINADSWYKTTDTVLYTVYAPNQAKLNEIVTYMVNLFKRFDVSAGEVNRFIQTAPGLDDAYLAYHYNYISVVSATGGTAPDIENDPIRATITLRVNYTNPIVDTPFT